MNLTKRIAAIAMMLTIVVSGALMASCGGSNPEWEKKKVEDAQQFLASLPGNMKAEKVEAAWADKSVTLTNISGNFEIMPGFAYDLKIEKTVISGIDDDAMAKNEVGKIIEGAVFTGMTFTANFEGMKSIGTLKEMSATDVRMNYADFKEQVKKVVDTKGEDKVALQALVKNALSIRAAKISYTDYVVKDENPFMPITMSVAKMEGKDVGMLNCGASSMEDMKAKVSGSDVLEIKKITLDSMAIPDIFSPAVSFADEPDMLEYMYPQIALEILKQQPIEIKNMVMEGFKVMVPGMEPVTMDKFKLDLSINGENIAVKHSTEKLTIPTSLISMMDRSMAKAFQNYDKPLVFSGAIDFSGKKDKDVVNFIMSGNVIEANLGEASGEMDMFVPMEEANNIFDALDYNDPMVRSMGGKIKDSGFLKLVFDMAYADESKWGYLDEKIKNSDDYRKDTVSKMRAEIPELKSPHSKAIALAFADFLEQGGTFDVSVKLKQPMDLNDAMDLEYEDPANFTVDVKHSK